MPYELQRSLEKVLADKRHLLNFDFSRQNAFVRITEKIDPESPFYFEISDYSELDKTKNYYVVFVRPEVQQYLEFTLEKRV